MIKLLQGAVLLLLASLIATLARAQWQRPDDLTGLLKEVPMDQEQVSDLARRYDLSTLSVEAANWGLDLWEPQTRDKVVLPTAHLLPDAKREGIVVNLAEYRLYYFKDGQVAFTAPIAHGEDSHPTPLGQTTVIRKKKDPVWTPTASTLADFPGIAHVVPPGPDNPLGGYAFYLKWPTYLIHGAVDPYAIGRRLTRGCVRLYEEDIERLFKIAPVGTTVTIVDQPVKLGWHGDELFIEAHPDFDQLEELRVKFSFTPKKAEPLDAKIIAAAAGRAPDLDWPRITAALEHPEGVPVQITSPRTHPVDITDHNLGS